MTYIIILFFFLIGIYVFEQNKKQGNRYYWFLCFLLIVLWGLRYHVGGDSVRYENHFVEYPFFSKLHQFDFKDASYQPIWYVYNSIIKSIYNSFTLLQIVHSTIINIGFFIFFKRYCSKKFLLATLYYVLWSPYFNAEILRESYSVLIFVFSYKYLIQRKYIRYYTCCIFAIFWHLSALFLFFVPIIYNIFNNIDNKKAIGLIFVVSLSSLWILNYIFSQSILYFLMLGGIARLESTLESGGLNVNGILFKVICLLPAFLLLYHFTSRKEQAKRITILLYIFVDFIGISFLPLQRLANYFLFFYLLLIVETYAETIGKKQSSLYKLCIIFIIILRINYYSKELDNGFYKYNLYYPYHSVIDSKIENDREYYISNEFLLN